MNKKGRPFGREKNVTEGGGNVHKRGDGLNIDSPVGSADGYDFKKGDNGSNRTANPIQQARKPQSFLSTAAPVRGTRTAVKLFPVLMVIILVVVYFAFMSGGSSDEPTANFIDTTGNGIAESNSATDYKQTTNTSVPNTGKLDTTVSDLARDKRTSIVGDGHDVVTIMIYMCGTDLETRSAAATKDLQEILNATMSDKLNIIIETGGTKKWQNNIIKNTANQRYRATSGGLELIADNLGKKSMVNPDTLTDFIKFCEKNYPADRNVLIFWDHGGGTLSGYGYDELFPSDTMTLDEINTALENAGVTFDLVGFDACLMATLETALIIEQYADYLLASEDTEPGSGWYYTDWITNLSANTSMPTLNIGKDIIDGFMSSTSQGPKTLSLIDLAELKGTVPKNFVSFSQSTDSLIKSDKYTMVASARKSVREFARSSGIDQVDLIGIAEDIGTKEAIELASALRGAVKYNRTDANITNAYGISIYFPSKKPQNLEKILDTYDKMGIDEEYANCIRSYSNLQLGGQIATIGSSGDSSLIDLLGSLLGSSTSGSTSGSGGMSELLTSVLSGAMGSEGGNSSNSLIAALISSFFKNDGMSLISGFSGKSMPSWVDQSLIESNSAYYANNLLDSEHLMFTDKNSRNVLALTEKEWELVQNIELNVFVDDGGGFIDLGLDDTFDFDDDGDLIAEYDGTWLALNRQVVPYYFVSKDGTADDYVIRGRVPAFLNGDLVDIIIEFTDEIPNGIVAGARINYGEVTDAEAKGLLEIVDGDKLDFVCDYYTYDLQFVNNYYLGEQMTVSNAIEVSNVSIGDKGYAASFRITDIFNNFYWTPGMK